MVDEWFLEKLVHLVEFENRLKTEEMTKDFVRELKQAGFTDKAILRLNGGREFKRHPYSYKMVDTCAARNKPNLCVNIKF